jgi:hypothetical protein
VRKYFNILIEHLDEKNPGLMINALTVLSKAIDVFSPLVD